MNWMAYSAFGGNQYHVEYACYEANNKAYLDEMMANFGRAWKQWVDMETAK